jgi:hypothetical protein
MDGETSAVTLSLSLFNAKANKIVKQEMHGYGRSLDRGDDIDEGEYG